MQSSAKAALVNLVEEHLTSLIGEAASVQRHAKRARFLQDTQQLRRRIAAQDINLALAWRGSEKIYARNNIVESHDQRIDLNAYLASETKARPPSEVGMTLHWLAVDGVQPEIPQNPVVGEQQYNIVVDEHQDQNNNNAVKVQQLLPRVLSEELQLYCTRITLAVERETPMARQEQDLALAGLQKDAGLQELVPFLIHYVVTQIYASMGNPEHLRTLVRCARALLSNPHLHLELQLPQLLSALMTCVVAKNLSSRPFQNEWALRTEAAQALIQACSLFGEKYTTLKARILKTLVETIAPSQALTTRFGGTTAISLFGPKAIDAFLLPVATDYWQSWENALEATSSQEERVQLQQCQQALLHALSVFFNCVNPSEISQRVDRSEFIDTFGERLVPLQSEPAEYTECVV